MNEPLLPVGAAASPDGQYQPQPAYSGAEEAEQTQHRQAKQAGDAGYGRDDGGTHDEGGDYDADYQAVGSTVELIADML